MAVREGVLWKWTNYYNGWQPRWFSLRDGVLSYFQSEDEVNVRCKGSIKLEACVVQCHSTDLTRFEVSAPRSCRLFLKAATPRERQLWFLTLHTEVERCKSQPNASTSSELAAATRSRSASIGSSSTPSELLDPAFLHEAKCKRSEIKLYGELLGAKLDVLKQLVVANTTGEPITDERFSETLQLISPTCSTLVAALDELAQLIEQAQTRIGGPTSPTPSLSIAEPFSDHSANVSTSVSGNVSSENHQDPFDQNSSAHVEPKVKAKVKAKPKTALRVACDLLSTLNAQTQDPRTETFLRLCSVFLGVLDHVRSAFANLDPVVADLDTNVRTIRSRFESDRNRYGSLDALLVAETQTSATAQTPCASALLWLKRAFEFLRIFLELVVLDLQRDVDAAVAKAYRAGLQVYHGSVLRGAFSTLTQAGLPNWPQIVRACSSSTDSAPLPLENTIDTELDRVACAEIAELTPALRRLTDSLNALLKRHNVDLNSMV